MLRKELDGTVSRVPPSRRGNLQLGKAVRGSQDAMSVGPWERRIGGERVRSPRNGNRWEEILATYINNKSKQ